MAAVLAQAIGQHTSGRARAHDDVVERSGLLHGRFLLFAYLLARMEQQEGDDAQEQDAFTQLTFSTA